MTKETKHPASVVEPGDEDRANEGVNTIWWAALVVSLGLWYALIDAAVWAIRQIVN